jgi:type IV secretory pathway VirD2 relaxase
MSEAQNCERPGNVEPDRIARMGGRRWHEPTVRNQLARRLKGFKGRPQPARRTRGFGAGGSAIPPGDRPQRVVVKTRVSRHRPGKARGSIARHTSYLGRDSASADGRPGTFYDAARRDMSAKSDVARWADDRHHFRVILSPERGADIPDMTAYVRTVMARVEQDLGAKLQWVGINHHNTDNPHAHMVIRGRREDGTDLVIPRRYIAHGMRRRAAEVATELLGQRSADDVRRTLGKEVRAERFTSLDRMIERHVEGGHIDVGASRRIGFDDEDRRLVVGRLQALEAMGLANKDRGTWWQLAPDFGRTLRDLGARNDVIRQLYATLGTEAGRVRRMGTGQAPEAPVAGVVIAKGAADELTDAGFLVVRDAAGQAHYARVAGGDAYRDLRVGSVAELGARAARRQALADEILAIATAQRGTYSAEAHAALLRAKPPASSASEIDTKLRETAAHLTSWALRDGSGVHAAAPAGDGFRIETAEFERFVRSARRARTDVRVLAAHPLPEQVEARAATWLDRQAFGGAADWRVAEHLAVREAVARRVEWLVRNGYAQAPAERPSGVELVNGALERLAGEERALADARLERRHGRPVAALPEGGSVTGTYGGIDPLHAGKRAVVVTDEAVYVLPVRRTPDVPEGAMVDARRTDAALEAVAGRAQARGAQRGTDGLEAGR